MRLPSMVAVLRGQVCAGQGTKLDLAALGAAGELTRDKPAHVDQARKLLGLVSQGLAKTRRTSLRTSTSRLVPAKLFRPFFVSHQVKPEQRCAVRLQARVVCVAGKSVRPAWQNPSEPKPPGLKVRFHVQASAFAVILK